MTDEFEAYVKPTLFGIRYYTEDTNEMSISEVYAPNAEEARRVFDKLGPKHKENFDVLELEDYKELLVKNGVELKSDV
jgi:hypothetical protein